MNAQPEIAQRPGFDLFDKGMQEFNATGYFEAHDIWEDLWHGLRGPDRPFLQSMIHLAVGAYHAGNGNAKGAKSQWSKALTKLSNYPVSHWGVDTGPWRSWIARYCAGTAHEPHPVGLDFDPQRFPTALTIAPE